jgi:hypothetical protein
MGSQSGPGVQRLTAQGDDTVLLTDQSPLSEIELADRRGESLRSRSVAADCDTAATSKNDAVEWLTRVLRCAVDGQGGHETEC